MTFFSAKNVWNSEHILLYVGFLIYFMLMAFIAFLRKDKDATYLQLGTVFVWMFLGLMPTTWSLMAVLLILVAQNVYSSVVMGSAAGHEKKKSDPYAYLRKSMTTPRGGIFQNWFTKKKSSKKPSSIYDMYRRNYGYRI